MKKLALALILFLTTFFFLNLVPKVSAADNLPVEKSVVLPKTETVNHDYVVAGQIVDLAGTVNGDAYLAGGNVTVEGVINGDLLIAGGNIDVKGSVTGNVRILGGNTIITGIIGKNLSVAGGSVNVTDSAKISGNVVGAGGSFVLFGPVTKDVRVAGGQITFGNTVGGNVFAGSGLATFTPNAKIAGDVTYWSNRKADVAPGAVITGKISQNALPRKNVFFQVRSEGFKSAVESFVFFGKIVSLISSFIIGLIFIAFFPFYAQKLSTAARNKFWKNVGIGLLTVIVTPIVIVLLLITVAGVPLAIFAGMAFTVLMYAAGILASLVIGKWVLKYVSKKEHLIWSLLVGLIIYKAVGLVPVFGWIFSAILTLAGLGAILIEKKHSYRQLREKKII